MNYRAFVGPEEKYDLMGAHQFNLLTALGLRDTHALCDVGAGSLRLGRLLIPYLNSGHYCAIEPDQKLIDNGLTYEVGQPAKKWNLNLTGTFDLSSFALLFDYIIAQSIFTHAFSGQLHQLFYSVSKNLAPNGKFLYTHIDAEPAHEGSEWTYPGMVTYPGHYMADLEAEYGLQSATNIGFLADAHMLLHPNKHTWRIATWQDQK